MTCSINLLQYSSKRVFADQARILNSNNTWLPIATQALEQLHSLQKRWETHVCGSLPVKTGIFQQTRWIHHSEKTSPKCIINSRYHNLHHESSTVVHSCNSYFSGTIVKKKIYISCLLTSDKSLQPSITIIKLWLGTASWICLTLLSSDWSTSLRTKRCYWV